MKRALTITATGKEAEKNMLRINRKSLRFLHDTDGFDFEMDHITIEATGTITANAITNLLSEHFKVDYKAVVMLHVTNARCNVDNGLHHGHIEHGTIDIDKDEHTYGYDICSEYRKSDFESYRKTCDRCFIIAQKESLIKHLVCKPYDYSERISVNAGNKHNVDYRADKKAFDKSGYYTKFIKEDYKQRVKALKAERAKNAANVYDCTADTEKIRTEIRRISNAMSELFTVPTVENIRKADNAMNLVRCLVNEFTLHERYIMEKSYSSINSIKRNIEDMENDIMCIDNILTE